MICSANSRNTMPDFRIDWLRDITIETLNIKPIARNALRNRRQRVKVAIDSAVVTHFNRTFSVTPFIPPSHMGRWEAFGEMFRHFVVSMQEIGCVRHFGLGGLRHDSGQLLPVLPKGLVLDSVVALIVPGAAQQFRADGSTVSDVPRMLELFPNAASLSGSDFYPILAEGFSMIARPQLITNIPEKRRRLVKTLLVQTLNVSSDRHNLELLQATAVYPNLEELGVFELNLLGKSEHGCLFLRVATAHSTPSLTSIRKVQFTLPSDASQVATPHCSPSEVTEFLTTLSFLFPNLGHLMFSIQAQTTPDILLPAFGSFLTLLLAAVNRDLKVEVLVLRWTEIALQLQSWPRVYQGWNGHGSVTVANGRIISRDPAIGAKF
ncbi:hypothetical protein HDU93_003553 [Gonapodya sp. JEL0774]|nr:hypothetical protein HDU93_003553 [Gonapodya sp. JEL0774]